MGRFGIAAVLVLGVPLVQACAIPHTMRGGPASPACRASGSEGPGEEVEITWLSPVQDRDRTMIRRWCSVVGPPVVDLQPKRGVSGPPDSLLVVAWNVYVGGGDMPGFLREEVGFSCENAGRSFDEPGFVLLLQEVHRASDDLPFVASKSDAPWRIRPDPPPGGRVDVVRDAQRCGLSLAYVPSARNGPDSVPHGASEDKGNAILSNLPLSEVSAIDLPFEAGRKVAVGATVELAGGQLVRLVSAHLDVSSTLVRILRTGNATRLRQALGLHEGMTLDPGGSAATWVLGGDFNTWSGNESTLRHLHRLFPDSPEFDGEATKGPFPADHIFVRRIGGEGPVVKDGSYRKAPSKHFSDHHPRLLWLGGS